MVKKVIYTEEAPKPIGPYSQAIKVGSWLFISGQIPIDPRTGEIVKGSFEDKVKKVLKNIEAIVRAAGGSLRDIVKVTVYLRDIKLFSRFNEVYKEFFKEEPPARVVIEVSALPKDADLEVEAIAYIGGDT